MSYANRLPVREAAKALLYQGDTIALVAGHSGRLNLPGGGIDPDETPLQALYRELHEELGLQHEHLRRIEEVGVSEGVVTSRNGEKMLARWTLFEAEMLIPESELLLGDDITYFGRVERSEVLQYTAPYISQLALNSIRLTT